MLRKVISDKILNWRVNNKGIGRFSEIWNMGHFLDISLDYMGDGCYYFSKKIVSLLCTAYIKQGLRQVFSTQV